ncbi:PREDICTED: uncharacterized protein LOC109327796 [Lupinus angustifolius]|uniref:uncharacterized protein LOC109327796 n=1 Tax=Lupinus angustifolius TaxID=3871 RepID=UPI00092F35B0|nr:PREDICTED: uncharacterized protein LOC109327796 [Lupinus angustifolius]
MDLLLLKNFTLIFLLISSSLLSTSFAGEGSKLDPIMKEVNEEEVRMIEKRVLRANRRDYGRYDPTPTLSKPPFKQIPN